MRVAKDHQFVENIKSTTNAKIKRIKWIYLNHTDSYILREAMSLNVPLFNAILSFVIWSETCTRLKTVG